MCLAIPGQIVELVAGGHLAAVEVSRVRRTINVDPRATALARRMGADSRRLRDVPLRLLAMLGEDAQAMAELDGYRFGEPEGKAAVVKERSS